MKYRGYDIDWFDEGIYCLDKRYGDAIPKWIRLGNYYEIYAAMFYKKPVKFIRRSEVE